MVTVLTKDEELVKAEAEAWHKTHYRSEWFVSRTLGYGVLISTLAIYIFWDATRWTPSQAEMNIGSALWILLLAIGLMIFDLKTRLSSETRNHVFRRLHKHLALGVATFLVSLGLAFAVHSGAALVAGLSTPQALPIVISPPVETRQPIPSVTVTKSKPTTKRVPKKAVAKPAPNGATKKPAVSKAAGVNKSAKPKPLKTPAKAAKPVKPPAKSKAVLKKTTPKKANPPHKAVQAKKKVKKRPKSIPAKKHHPKKHKRGGMMQTSLTTSRSQRFYQPEATAD